MIDRGMLDYVMARVRPQIQADGGDVEVTELDDEQGIVYVALKGACVDCPLSALTLSQGIERVLCEHVPGVVRVLPDVNQTEAMQGVMGGMGAPIISGADDDDDDEDDDDGFDASDRFGDPVRVTRVDKEGNITEGIL